MKLFLLSTNQKHPLFHRGKLKEVSWACPAKPLQIPWTTDQTIDCSVVPFHPTATPELNKECLAVWNFDCNQCIPSRSRWMASSSKQEEKWFFESICIGLCPHTASEPSIYHTRYIIKQSWRSGVNHHIHLSQTLLCVTLGHRERSPNQNKHISVVLAYLPDRKLLPDRGGERVEGQTSTLEVLITARCQWEQGREK